MEILTQKYKRNPNAMVHSAYVGVVPGGRTVTRITAVNKDQDRMDASRTYGAGISRGQGGRVATLILGGMETTLDEIEYIVEGLKAKKFVAQKKPSDIATMCRALAERRNDRVKYLRKNPSEAPKKPRGPVLHLPVGYRMVNTAVPGMRVAMKG